MSSDHPYGIIEFDGSAYRNVSEDVGQVTLNVIRHKGHTGRLLITVNVVTTSATEGRDFQVAPKGIRLRILSQRVSFQQEIFVFACYGKYRWPRWKDVDRDRMGKDKAGYGEVL